MELLDRTEQNEWCIVDGLYPMLRKFAAVTAPSDLEPDDLLQEAYLRYLRSGFEGEDEDHRKNYLYKIATNLLRDHFRRKRSETDEVPERDDRPGHDRAVHMKSDVGSAMSELSPRDRQMLWLAYVEGSSHTEIAAALGLRTASIRSMLFRARQRLATRLASKGLHPGGGQHE